MNIIIVSGGFDPIHSGHIAYLKPAKEEGDRLIVALNSDEWLIKKKSKFFMPFAERKTILENITFVDEVIDFEDDDTEQFGAAQIQHLPQTQLLDGYACIQCSRCQDACPAYETGKELSPSALEINKRYFFNENLDLLAKGEMIDKTLTDWMLTEEAAWSCTTCGYCVEVCPVGNEPMLDILRSRQNLVMMDSKFPKDAMETFDKMENYGNPWGLSPQDREVWMEGKDIPLMRDKKQTDVLYWAGCSGAYDQRGKEISQSVVDVLKKAGVNFASLTSELTLSLT